MALGAYGLTRSRSWKAKVLPFIGVLQLVMIAVVVAAPPAQAACDPGFYRAWDYTGSLDGTGVKGTLRTPLSASEVADFGSGMPSAGDVVLLNPSTGGFVQMGWYVGSDHVGGLPYANVPRVFYGENDGAGGEVLRPGPGLGWNAYHNFAIMTDPTPGVYDFYFDLAYSTDSVHTHADLYAARHNGEINSSCTRMAARANESSAPARTLRWRDSGGSWSYFTDHWGANDPILFSGFRWRHRNSLRVRLTRATIGDSSASI